MLKKLVKTKADHKPAGHLLHLVLKWQVNFNTENIRYAEYGKNKVIYEAIPMQKRSKRCCE